MPGRQVLFAEGAHGVQSGQCGFDRCGVEGRILDQKIPGPLLDRLDRVSDIAMAGQHKDIHVWLMLADPLQDSSTVEAWHTEIGDDAFEGCGLQCLDACRTVSDGGHLTALLAECLLQHQANVFFVVDDECAHHSRFQESAVSIQRCPECRLTVSWPSGNARKNVLPLPGDDSGQTQPPCWSATIFTMARPTPVPSYSWALCTRSKRPKSFFFWSASKPMPLSCIQSIRSVDVCCPPMLIFGAREWRENLRALSSRLTKA